MLIPYCQYFLRTADADIERYLRLLTFVPLSEISSLMAENDKDRGKRLAQRRLAFEVLCVVHGEKEAKAAKHQSQAIFGSNSDSDTPNALKNTFSSSEPEKLPNSDWNFAVNKYAPHVTSADRPAANITLPRSLVVNQPLSRVLYAAKLVSSRSEGHRVVVERGAYVGSLPGQKGGMGDKLEFNRVVNWQPGETERFIIDGSLLILRVGKWNVRLIRIVSDEEFEKLGEEAPPGWEEFKEGKREEAEVEGVKVKEGGKKEGSNDHVEAWAKKGLQRRTEEEKVKRRDERLKRKEDRARRRWGEG